MTKFQPKNWHACRKSDWHCTEGVNCYAYALNNSNYHWAVPGFGYAHTETKKYFNSFSKKFRKMSLRSFREKLVQGAKNDGLILVKGPRERDGFRVAALYFSKKEKDFHWYRKDANGTWSHKMGYKKPTNTDESGKMINNPETANRGEYAIFGGYYLIPKKGIKLFENTELE